MLVSIPGETRVRIEYLLTYINDIGTITSYLQIPREWVEHTFRNHTRKNRRSVGAGKDKVTGRPTDTERNVKRSTGAGCANLLARYNAVYEAHAWRTGLPPSHCAMLLMNCEMPKSAIVSKQNGVDSAPRKERRK